MSKQFICRRFVFVSADLNSDRDLFKNAPVVPHFEFRADTASHRRAQANADIPAKAPNKSVGPPMK
jgi:hypothetical protein